MINKLVNNKYLLFFIICVFSVVINHHYGNIGALPIDSFAFLDTGYSILKNKHPIKDYWIISGPLIDYIQAGFFKIFGINWSTYVLHASVFNLLIASSFFIILIKHNLNIFYSFIYAISVSVLCYPVMGTPFSYQHSFILSLISIFIFTIAIKSKSPYVWFSLPIVMVFAFLCNQSPAAYINLTLIIFTLIYFIVYKNIKNIFYFFLGSLSICLFLLLIFYFIKIPIQSFIEQILLFPLTIGEARITGSEEAYAAANLFKKFTFRGVIGHFKFIHLFILAIAFIAFFNLKIKKEKIISSKDFFMCMFLIVSALFYIFHQLITANQTHIFSLIPILAGFFHSQISSHFSSKKYLHLTILIIVIFSTFKYHNDYNINRKFQDLQKIDLTTSLDATLIDKKFKNFKWITSLYETPEKEVNLIINTLEKIKNDKRRKMVITHYQFFSFILEEDLNIPNRWYYGGNNTFPLKGHKYFDLYKRHFNNSLSKNNIQVIYIVDPGEIEIETFKNYLNDICFNSKYENEMASSHELIPCTNN